MLEIVAPLFTALVNFSSKRGGISVPNTAQKPSEIAYPSDIPR